ncbi:class I SAM-dependent methyltransferase [Ferrovibrio sp.]|uniref:class I SAM-dependent methyltransferase n=1 Tax=Ferrovibrio sp. TaxID=1917215 RepID=UPI003D13A18A
MSLISILMRRPVPWGHLDTVEVDPSGLVRLVGWSFEAQEPQPPNIFLDDCGINFLGFYRVTRPDLGGGLRGVVMEFLATDEVYQRGAFKNLTIEGPGISAQYRCSIAFRRPAYEMLLTETRVLHREHIYCSGPPSLEVNDDVLRLTATLVGDVLDFGCGSGALVANLRQRGVNAVGLECDVPAIHAHMLPEVVPHVTLYDGALPSPFADASFDCVISTEVIEHIPNYAAAIAEMRRLTRNMLIVTVPDMSAVPMGSRHSLVPWHLLESTHINFFNQKSLEAALQPHFSSINFARICPFALGDNQVYTSIAAVCTI